MDADWGYSATNGPSTWVEKFPEASGSQQSPVDIPTSSTMPTGSLPPLKWTYNKTQTRSLVNPGYCWKVEENGRGSELTGGPLGDSVYRLAQFHCHWGCSDGKGSEHTVDGKAYSAELHLVHWNCTKYNSLEEAGGQSDGLAVLGIFVKVGGHHAELEKIVQLLPFITHKGDKITMNNNFSPDPEKLLPSNLAYWTYPGSLTTPPCTESVTWMLFKEPIEVGRDQLNKFRELRTHGSDEESHCDEGVHVINNYRPPLPLGNRVLRDCGVN